MNAPEPRPKLADTIAHIEAVLAEGRRCTVTAQRRDVGSADPFTAERCTPDALPGSDRCSLHTPVGEYLLGLPLDVRPRGGITENGKVLPWSPYLQPALDEVARQSAAKPRHLPGPPGPTCPGCAARDARPGWLARALNRLFGGAS